MPTSFIHSLVKDVDACCLHAAAACMLHHDVHVPLASLPFTPHFPSSTFILLVWLWFQVSTWHHFYLSTWCGHFGGSAIATSEKTQISNLLLRIFPPNLGIVPAIFLHTYSLSLRSTIFDWSKSMMAGSTGVEMMAANNTKANRLFWAYIISFSFSSAFCHAQRSDPSQFNGGSILAMAGRNSVAIAIDARFGLGMQTISTGESMTAGDRRLNIEAIAVADDDATKDEEPLIDEDGVGVGNPRILHLPNSNTLMAWTGLHGDGMSFAEEINWMLARKERKAGCMGFPGISMKKRKMCPRAITMLISHMLYRRRNAPYYVETVIVGLERVRVPIVSDETTNAIDSVQGNDNSFDNRGRSTAQKLLSLQKAPIPTPARDLTAYRTMQKPYLCGTDMLGAKSLSRSFICSGVASKSLHGTAEALWRPGLEGEELVEVCGKAFVSALERDILSGYGAVVYLIQGIQEEDGRKGVDTDDEVRIIEYILACRND